MDFFEAQERAKKRTTRLVVLFAFALLGLIAAGYVALVGALTWTDARTPDGIGFAPGWWQPRLLAGVSAVTVAIVGVASLFKWLTLRSGGRAVAEMVGARALDPSTRDPAERRLLNVVEEMAIASGVPLPAVYVMDGENGINAFAAGLTTSDAVVAVTQGTLEKLSRDELQGVVAHEFSHILNGDMRLNVKLTAIVFGILVIGLIGRGVLRSLRFSRPRQNSKNGGGAVVILAAGLALMILGYIGFFFGRLIQAAVSRQREYLADAAAVQFTRNPAGITGALKKIGGYALGSNLVSNQSAQIGHFFFAQGFRARLGGLWATHPPLPDRIRAIDASFDGTYFTPPTKVDVAVETWDATGTVAPRRNPPGPVAAPAATAVLGLVGTLPDEAPAQARTLLATLPPILIEAAHTPGTAESVLYFLLLSGAPAVRHRQLELIAAHDRPEARAQVERMLAAVPSIDTDHRIPLAQVALGAVRSVPAARISVLLGALDELVHADAQVSTYEYALQKMIAHHLKLAHRPATALQALHSFHAVAPEIAVTLSALARSADNQPERAFAAGRPHLRLIESSLHLAPAEACGLAQLDAALDKLGRASLPIKRQVLLAAAAVTTADGQLEPAEAELLRAVAAVLDCPLPSLTRLPAPA